MRVLFWLNLLAALFGVTQCMAQSLVVDPAFSAGYIADAFGSANPDLPPGYRSGHKNVVLPNGDVVVVGSVRPDTSVSAPFVGVGLVKYGPDGARKPWSPAGGVGCLSFCQWIANAQIAQITSIDDVAFSGGLLFVLATRLEVAGSPDINVALVLVFDSGSGTFLGPIRAYIDQAPIRGVAIDALQTTTGHVVTTALNWGDTDIVLSKIYFDPNGNATNTDFTLPELAIRQRPGCSLCKVRAADLARPHPLPPPVDDSNTPVYLAATTELGPFPGNPDFLLARFASSLGAPAGTRQIPFNEAGSLQRDFAKSLSIVRDASGVDSIWLVGDIDGSCKTGIGVVKLNGADGVFDPTFGNAGKAIISEGCTAAARDLSSADSIVQQGELAIVGARNQGSDFESAVYRANSSSAQAISIDPVPLAVPNSKSSLRGVSPAGLGQYYVSGFAQAPGFSGGLFITARVGMAPPSFLPAAALLRQQGSNPGPAAVLGNVENPPLDASTISVTQTAGGSATGVTIGTVMNTGGTIFAPVSASCSATSGTVRLVSSNGRTQSTGSIQVNVSPNTPPTLEYAAQTVDGGGGVSAVPTAGPSDTGSIVALAVQSRGTFTGTISVGSSGVVSIADAAPVGRHTITIRAIDNCGIKTDASFDLTVNNTPPSFVPAPALTRQQGSPSGSVATLGVASDLQSPPGSLSVTEVAGGTATGILLDGLQNNSGAISARVSASCSAASGSVNLQVFDGSVASIGTFQVNVLPDSPPQLSYAAQAVSGGASITVNPVNGPTDNGSVSSIYLRSLGTYTGTISVDSIGSVRIADAAPIGVHTIVVTATDNCGHTVDASFQLTVNNTPPVFTSAASLTRQQGSPAGPLATIGTVSNPPIPAGNLVVTQTSGGTASGISVAAITNNAGSVTAAVNASCLATSGNVRMQVSNGSIATFGDLLVDVTPNTAPVLQYLSQDIGLAGSAAIPPSLGPSDNGTILSVFVASPGTFAGNISINPTTGVVTVSNASPAGNHLIAVSAIDNCGLRTDSLLQLSVTPSTTPDFLPAAGISRQQGSAAGAAVVLGSASNPAGPAGSLMVARVPGGTATGITIGNISNSNGVITAPVAASCLANGGTVRLQVSNGVGASIRDLQIDVTPNTRPILGSYPDAVAILDGNVSITPSTTPTDNGSIDTLVVHSDAGTFAGTLAIPPDTGIVQVTSAQPSGTFALTVTATDNCGSATVTSTTLSVRQNLIFDNGFEQ